MRLWVVLVLIGAVIAGCGDDSAGSETPASELAVPWIDPDGDPPIVGSLTVNPADSTLFMATNTGLFRIPEGASKPEKLVGRLETPDGSGEVSEALVVRFVGPDTLLGSGHPAAGSTLPQALGLIRSEDAGKTWTSVSELGTADFHALEPVGDEIVASLFQQPQVLVSNDAGKTWQTRAAPLPLVAIEVNPADPKVWIGSTDRGIFISRDAGQGWRQLDPTPNSRFAWAEDTLYRVDPGGPVKVSTDGGEQWEDRGSTGGEPQAMTVDQDGKLYVALIDGTLKVSEDGGETFTDQVKGG
jgi:Sortilin, neurotensin receptor 3,